MLTEREYKQEKRQCEAGREIKIWVERQRKKAQGKVRQRENGECSRLSEWERNPRKYHEREREWERERREMEKGREIDRDRDYVSVCVCKKKSVKVERERERLRERERERERENGRLMFWPNLRDRKQNREKIQSCAREREGRSEPKKKWIVRKCVCERVRERERERETDRQTDRQNEQEKGSCVWFSDRLRNNEMTK